MFKKQAPVLLSMILPLLATLALLGALHTPAAKADPSAIITVDTLLDENDGSCTDGDCSLRDAIAAANVGDTVDFSISGTITLSSTPHFLGQLTIDKSLTISGGVPITVSGNNAVRVFNVMSSALDVTFDGLTIIDGNVQTTDCGPFVALCGGGIMIQDGGTAVTVTNSALISNSADAGGGILNLDGALTVNNTVFISNWAGGGGGIYNHDDGTVNINNSVFSGNAGDDTGGGGIENHGMIEINSSTFSNNWATDGGGIYNFGTTTINNSALYGNSSYHAGGGTYNGGGGIRNSQGSLTVNNSTLSGNETPQNGGGIYLYQGTVTLNSSTLSDNTASDGGGIYNSFGTLNLQNIIVANSNSSGDCYNGGVLGTDVYNLIEVNNGCGAPVSTADPLLGALQDNGGSTLTHALLPGSPAIDAGDPAYPVQEGDYDQRGVGYPRVMNGRIDIGAYEFGQDCSSPIVVTSTVSSGAGSLRQAITDVCYGGLITFDASLSGNTIDISPDGELVISKSLTINGSVPITVSGNNAVRVFNVMSSALDVTFDGLTIMDGNVQTTDCGATGALCGGGIMIQNGGTAVTVTNSALISNIANDAGGGIFNLDGVLTVNNTVFISNSAGGGGGIYNYGTMTLNSSALSNNWATDGGGIHNYGTTTINNSVLYGNSSLYFGGGIHNAWGALTLNNSTLSGNDTGQNGGGIYLNQGTVTINSSTLSDNTASDGGGLYNLSGTLNLQNTIVANSNSSGDCYNGGVLGTDVYNLIEVNNGCGAPVSTADPLLGGLQDNGGSTLTHALLPGSPAIDAGDPAYPVQEGDYDQRGVGYPRVMNGRIDIGAYEMEMAFYNLTVSVDGTGSGTVNSSPPGIDCGDDCSEAYMPGTVVTLTAVSPISSTFTGWSGAIVTTTNPITLTMDAVKAVTATFVLNTHELSLTLAGNGVGSVNFNPPDTDCTADCSETYDYGTVVTLTATADAGFFAGWSGASCGGAGVCILTMDADMDVTATFSLYDIYLPVILKP